MEAQQPIEQPVPQQSDEIEAVRTMKVPPFWRDRPRLWFAQFEFAIGLKRADDYKFRAVISELERQDIDQVSDIILDPPQHDKYDALKTRLLNVYEESANKQLQKLLSDLDLGSDRPSSLLRKMRDLAKGKLTDAALRQLWKNRLPSHVRAILAVLGEDTSLDTLASQADLIVEQAYGDINQVERRLRTPPREASTTPKEEGSLLQRLAALEKAIERLSTSQPQPHVSHRHRSYARDRSSSRNRSQSRQNICFYHRRFAERARKCIKPCKFSPKQQEN